MTYFKTIMSENQQYDCKSVHKGDSTIKFRIVNYANSPECPFLILIQTEKFGHLVPVPLKVITAVMNCTAICFFLEASPKRHALFQKHGNS